MARQGNEAAPLVVAIGGTLRENSSTEKALRVALAAAEAAGARTRIFSGAALDLPSYAPERQERTAEAQAMIAALREADGILIGSPGYHGGVSGLVKNALDYTEDMRGDPRCYFDGLPVGCVATGAGWQGAVVTLTALRGIVHALRGWNTPVGVPINTIEPVFDKEGACIDDKVKGALTLMAEQVVEFARLRAGASAEAAEVAG